MVATRVVDGEALGGLGVFSRSHRGKIDVMFGPLITNEFHLAFYGARIHSISTAEMIDMIKHCRFLVFVVV